MFVEIKAMEYASKYYDIEEDNEEYIISLLKQFYEYYKQVITIDVSMILKYNMNDKLIYDFITQERLTFFDNNSFIYINDLSTFNIL